MKKGIMIEAKIVKSKDKKQLKRSLVVSLSESILMKKTLTFLRLKAKYLDTLKNL